MISAVIFSLPILLRGIKMKLSLYYRHYIIMMVSLMMVIIIYSCESNRYISAEETAYIAEIKEWHAKRIERLKSKTGWLSLAGLYWLEEGENTFGSQKDNDIRFPEEKSPEHIGSFFVESDEVRVEIRAGITVLHEGNPVKSLQMQPDISGNPTILALDSLNWFIIKRGDRYGVRLRDRESDNIKNFEGVERFQIDTTWRITAKLELYDPPKKIEIPNITGTISEENSPGALVFTIEGKEYQLDPLERSGGKSLFLIFADQTNGIETYGAGRFLYAKMPGEDGLTVIDFNKAYSPPCAFTRYATCPLPPQQNVLPIPVSAGEKGYGEH